MRKPSAMATVHDLAFASSSLRIAYRATAEPQDVDVEVILTGAPFLSTAFMVMRRLLSTINSGGAGGATFAPTVGFGEQLSGPIDDATSRETRAAFKIRIGGVDPIFLRTMVDEMAGTGAGRAVAAMSIVGSVPVDSSPLSVREGTVRGWLADPFAYVAGWPGPYPFDLGDGDRGPDGVPATIHVRLDGEIDLAKREALEDLAYVWLGAINSYSSERGEAVNWDPNHTLPYFGHNKTEFRAFFPRFFWTRPPARAALVNMLTRFHAKVAPLAAAKIGV